jgi:RNase P/RNase MRP subunit p30
MTRAGLEDDREEGLRGHTYDTICEVLIKDLVPAVRAPRDGRAAKLQLVEKQALLLEPLGRKSARRALAMRRVDIEAIFVVDRGFDRLRSHDLAAERQKRADI